MELYGLTREDHDALGRMMAAYAAGSFSRKPQTLDWPGQRVYESVPFINATSPLEVIPAYAVMRITTPTTVSGEKIVNCAKPDGTYHWRYLINGSDSVIAEANAIGFGTYAFDSDKILYDTGSTPTFDEEWGPKSGEWKLFQHRPGFILDGRYDATEGTLWAQQVIPNKITGKVDASVTSGSTATVSVYSGTAGSESDTGLNISSVYLRYGYVPTDGFVTVAREHGKPYIIDDHRTVIVKADSTISKGSSGTCSIWNNNSDTGDNITATAYGAAVTGSKYATAWQEEKSGTWSVACWET